MLHTALVTAEICYCVRDLFLVFIPVHVFLSFFLIVCSSCICVTFAGRLLRHTTLVTGNCYCIKDLLPVSFAFYSVWFLYMCGAQLPCKHVLCL